MILSRYITAWGQPKERVVSRNDAAMARIEVYSFPANEQTRVHRVATVGVSTLISLRTKCPMDAELLFVLPSDLGGASFEAVADYALDIAVFGTRENVWFEVGRVFPESERAPQTWRPRALLIDEPRGEAEELSEFVIGRRNVALLWVIPVFESEAALIASKGLAAFDELEQRADVSVADVRREPLLQM